MGAFLQDGTDTLEFGHDAGLIVRRLDLGFPAVRQVADRRTDADGLDDRTARHGSRAVTIEATVVAADGRTVPELVDSLRAFCRPSSRPYLYFDVDAERRRVRLRADQQTDPLTNRHLRDLQASWVAPDGIIEAADLSVVDISATTEDETGRSYDLAFDRTYPASAPVGSATVTNSGTTDGWPVIRVYGPCDDPRLINGTYGAEVAFVGLTVPAGDYLEVDMRERTARINGERSASRLSRLDFATSEWWPLTSGDNAVRFAPASFSGASQMQVRYRHAWL